MLNVVISSCPFLFKAQYTLLYSALLSVKKYCIIIIIRGPLSLILRKQFSKISNNTVAILD